MKTLYILHGWTYKPEPWETVIKDLKKLGVEAKLLRVPGLGEPSDEVFTIEDYVKWAKKQLPKGAIALGHSNGGRILLNLLAEDPKYLNGIILLDAAGVWEESKKRNALRGASKVLSPLKKVPLARTVVHKLMGSSDYSHAPENMKKTLDNMIQSDKALDISKVTTPVQIIWGADDNITPLRQGKTMHERLKNSELTVKDGWRHSHYLVSTEELAAEIADKYKKLNQGSKNA